MTPAPPQLAPPRARSRVILTAVLGVVLLAAVFLPARNPVTHRLAAEWRPSAELAGVLFLIAMAALASPRLIAERGFAFLLAGKIESMNIIGSLFQPLWWKGFKFFDDVFQLDHFT